MFESYGGDGLSVWPKEPNDKVIGLGYRPILLLQIFSSLSSVQQKSQEKNGSCRRFLTGKLHTHYEGKKNQKKNQLLTSFGRGNFITPSLSSVCRTFLPHLCTYSTSSHFCPFVWENHGCLLGVVGRKGNTLHRSLTTTLLQWFELKIRQGSPAHE